MDIVLIFLPVNILKLTAGYLLGFYKEEFRSKCLYVVGTEATTKKKTVAKEINFVGYFSSKLGKIRSSHKISQSESVWIQVKCFNDSVAVEYCSIFRKTHPLKDCLVVLYNVNSFNKSELLLHPKNLLENDHFRKLAKCLQLQVNNKLKNNSRYKWINWIKLNLSKICDIPIYCIVQVFKSIAYVLSKVSFIIRHSALATHLMNYSQSIVWTFQTYKSSQCVDLKLGNCFLAVIFDICTGILVYYTITSWRNPREIFETLSIYTESVIDTITEIVKWLMGSPAGLKLNEPLNNILGSLVLYYLEIWRSFLRIIRPILEVSFFVLLKLGFLGVTFFLAVCADIFAIISFHVYCIYIYAARLYEIQAKGLCSLSRLVLGRKRNPEPGKIDSCPYSTEELLIGTISFAVLLFLLPTTLVYYIVFTVMRVGVLTISGLMTRTIYLMQILPAYSTFLWIFFPSYTATTVKLTPLYTSQTGHGTLFAKLTNSSWMDTIKYSIPVAVSPPSPIRFGDTISKILVGKLI